MAKSCRCSFLIFFSIIVVSCSYSKDAIKGNVIFSESTIPSYDYEFAYCFYNDNQEQVAKGMVNIFLFSRFSVKIPEGAEYFKLFISHINSSLKYDNVGALLSNEFGKELLEIKKIKGTRLQYTVATSVTINDIANRKFTKASSVCFDWNEKKSIDYYGLEIFRKGETESLLFAIIPHKMHSIAYENLQSATKIDSYAGILDISQCYLLKGSMEMLTTGDYEYRVAGFVFLRDKKQLYQTIFPQRYKASFTIEN